MKKLILALIIMPSFLIAGNVFKSTGDIEWWKGALEVKEITGYQIVESEISTVIGHKYWDYKLKIQDAPNIFKNLKLQEVHQLLQKEDLIAARKLLPPDIQGAEIILYVKKTFYYYCSDIFIVVSKSEVDRNVMHVVFCGEPFRQISNGENTKLIGK